VGFSCSLFAYIIEEHTAGGFLSSSLTTLIIGGILFGISYNHSGQISKKEGYLTVTMSWLSMCFIFCLPYFFLLDLSLTDAIFESMSGLSTTGATIFNDIEVLPKSILLWRSLSQWIGGMGIIVLTIALLPMLGVGGVELFTAEAPGPTSAKIHPRIQEVAKRLWIIYVGLTVLLTVILWYLDMSVFDAVNHALTTMATGGFSTKNASIGHFNSPAIEYVLIVFMILAGINYTILFFLLTRRFSKVVKNEEFKIYIGLLLLISLLVFAYLVMNSVYPWTDAIRHALFQVVSVITTTGFGTQDFTAWGPVMVVLFFILLFIGGSAGSTSGGIKMLRHLVIIKNSYLEFNRLMHPKGVIRIKVNNESIQPRIISHILIFVLIYLIIFFFGSMIIAGIGADFTTAVGIAATSIGNVGPGIGDVGPSNTFSVLTNGQKWVSVALMLLGRLELFSVLILFTPFFWKS